MGRGDDKSGVGHRPLPSCPAREPLSTDRVLALDSPGQKDRALDPGAPPLKGTLMRPPLLSYLYFVPLRPRSAGWTVRW